MPLARPELAGIQFPYVEGLRLDEAMHPLALLSRRACTARRCRTQDGAPVRLVVPWKYGFKSIKSIVKIKLVEKQPPTTWNMSNAREYGFYSNVNPERGSSALEPGDRAAAAANSSRTHDADVQRLRRPGGQPLRGHGPEEELLS